MYGDHLVAVQLDPTFSIQLGYYSNSRQLT